MGRYIAPLTTWFDASIGTNSEVNNPRRSRYKLPLKKKLSPTASSPSSSSIDCSDICDSEENVRGCGITTPMKPGVIDDDDCEVTPKKSKITDSDSDIEELQPIKYSSAAAPRCRRRFKFSKRVWETSVGAPPKLGGCD